MTRARTERRFTRAQICQMAETCHQNRLVFLLSLRQRRTLLQVARFVGLVFGAALATAMLLR